VDHPGLALQASRAMDSLSVCEGVQDGYPASSATQGTEYVLAAVYMKDCTAEVYA
jgi:hypothetical protein